NNVFSRKQRTNPTRPRHTHCERSIPFLSSRVYCSFKVDYMVITRNLIRVASKRNIPHTLLAMAVTFYDVNSDAGLKKLDAYLLTRSYITGYQASKDDVTVYAAFSKAPSSQYVNVCRWYNHIDALLRISGVSAEGSGVTIEGSAPITEAVATPPVGDTKAAAAEDDDDDDVDLFGEETEEEKKAAEERAAAVKASAKKKESGKSSVLLDVKPWDDETDMKKLEEAVRGVHMEGLLWGASKLAPVGYGIKKMQIMLTIVDDLVSVDNLIEERLMEEPINEYVQSCDIVAFNKI
ncbi:Elongation factor 1-delta, partial [Melia azedarach]